MYIHFIDLWSIHLTITLTIYVVYFDQLSGVARTRKLVRIHFWPLYNHFLFIFNVFNYFVPLVKSEKVVLASESLFWNTQHLNMNKHNFSYLNVKFANANKGMQIFLTSSYFLSTQTIWPSLLMLGCKFAETDFYPPPEASPLDPPP